MDNKIDSKKIGITINTLLATREMQQKELASKIGVTDNTISYWCKGKRTPNLSQIIKIANIFNVSIDYLVGNEQEELNDVEKILIASDFLKLNPATIIQLHNVDFSSESEITTVSKVAPELFCNLVDKVIQEMCSMSNTYLDILESYRLYLAFVEKQKTNTNKEKTTSHLVNTYWHSTIGQMYLFTSKLNQLINDEFEFDSIEKEINKAKERQKNEE